MIKYSNEERFAALNEAMKDGLTIEGRNTGSNVFTILTQWFRAESIEHAADYMIHYKKFLEMYNYDRQDLFFDMQEKNLSSQRFKAFFDENRVLTEKEEKEAIEKDRAWDERWAEINKEFNEQFAQKLCEDLFNEHFEVNKEKKEIKIRKWNTPDDTIPTTIK